MVIKHIASYEGKCWQEEDVTLANDFSLEFVSFCEGRSPGAWGERALVC